MNNRIRELRQQATLVETYTSHDGSVHEGKHVDLEKFAELIIDECANICLQQSRVGWNDDRKMQAKLDSQLIKENFGVK